MSSHRTEEPLMEHLRIGQTTLKGYSEQKNCLHAQYFYVNKEISKCFENFM